MTITAATPTGTGSLLVTMFERVWTMIQDRHPDVPHVVFITGAGQNGAAVTWGHFWAHQWDTLNGRMHELFVSGECLTREPHEILQTMLHEAAHAVNCERGENGTSRRGKYHNKTFVAAATELGLEWAEGKVPCDYRGFSEVTITPATMLEYAEALELISDTRVAWRNLMPVVPGGNAGTGGDAGDGGDGGDGKPRKPRSRNTKPKAVCRCESDNTIWLSRKTLAEKRPMCGVCMFPYELHPDYV